MRIIFCFFGLFLLTLSVNAQFYPGAEPGNAEFVIPSFQEDTEEIVFNESAGSAILPALYRRIIPNKNAFFSFSMPAGNDVEIQLRNHSNAPVGIAAYKVTPAGYAMITSTDVTRISGKMRVGDVLAGKMVLVHLYSASKVNNADIEIAFVKKEPINQTKAISVDVVTYTPQELVEEILITGCLSASNISYTGDPQSIGYFSGGNTAFGFDDGVILCSGNATDAEGPNTGTGTGTNMGANGDADLTSIVGATTYDAAVLEFDFVPASDQLHFEYVFGSDEYMEYANSNYNDGFAFILDGGPENYNNENIALLPGTSTPVSINNVNETSNPGYYISNEPGNEIEYDGYTVTLVAEADVTMCETYHIKLVVADCYDGILDSGVFLKAGSFASGESYTMQAFNPWFQTDVFYESCETNIVFYRMDSSSVNEDVPVDITIGGNAIENDDYSDFPDNPIIPAGEYSDTITIEAYDDGITEGTEYITFTFENGCPCTSETSTDTLFIEDALNPQPVISNSGPICVGYPADLYVDFAQGYDSTLIDVVWESGDTSLLQTVNPTVTTTYNAEVLYPCQTLNLSTTVDVVEPPVVDLGPDQEVTGLETGMNADPDPGNTGSWTMIDGPGDAVFADPNDPASQVVVDTFGTYTFVWEEYSLPPNCFDSDTIEITFFHIPTAEFELTPILCYGDTVLVSFTGDTYDWASFNWDFDGALVVSGDGSGPYELLYDNPGTHTIHLEVVENANVAENSEDLLIPPELTHILSVFDGTCNDSCNGSAEVEVSGGTPSYDYSWASGAPENPNLCAGDYSLTVTDANGCITTDSFTINEPPELVYDTAYTNLSCYNADDGTMQINVSGGVEPYTYAWTNSFTDSSQQDVPAGAYSVSVTDANGCSISETFVLTQPNPLQAAISPDILVCEGQTVYVNAQHSGGTSPYTYTWNHAGDFVDGQSSFQDTPDNDTIYAVQVVDGHGCESPVAEMEVTVSPTMSLALNTTDNLCYGDCQGAASVTVSGGLQPFSFSWDYPIQNITGLCAGFYTLTVSDDIGCTVDTSFYIYEPPVLTAELVTEDASCYGAYDGMAYIHLQGGVPPYSYLWSNGVTNDTISANGGMHYVTVSDANGCQIDTSVFVGQPEEILISDLGNVWICQGESTVLSASVLGGVGPYSYHWHGEDGSDWYANNFEVSPLETTQYHLTITDENGCTAQKGPIHVNVYPDLNIHVAYPNQDSVCPGQPVTIIVDVNGGNGGPYQLHLQDGQVVSSPFTVYPEESGPIIITAGDMCGTPSVTDTVDLFVYELPPNNFVADHTHDCPPAVFHFNETNEDEGYDYLWSFGDDGYAFIKNPAHTYTDPGTYNVKLTVTDENGCERTRTIADMITIHHNPVADFSVSPTEVSILDPEVTFMDLSVHADSIYWVFGDGDSLLISTHNPIHYFDHVGEYEVEVIAENTHGCIDTAMKTVHVSDQFTFYAPTGFSPNGDGLNDCFRVCGRGVDPGEFVLMIYNRWGEKVFETDTFYESSHCSACGAGSWDGTMQGQEGLEEARSPAGVYTWYCKFKDTTGIWQEYSGRLRLIR